MLKYSSNKIKVNTQHLQTGSLQNMTSSILRSANPSCQLGVAVECRFFPPPVPCRLLLLSLPGERTKSSTAWPEVWSRTMLAMSSVSRSGIIGAENHFSKKRRRFSWPITRATTTSSSFSATFPASSALDRRRKSSSRSPSSAWAMRKRRLHRDATPAARKGLCAASTRRRKRYGRGNPSCRFRRVAPQPGTLTLSPVQAGGVPPLAIRSGLVPIIPISCGRARAGSCRRDPCRSTRETSSW